MNVEKKQEINGEGASNDSKMPPSPSVTISVHTVISAATQET
jgi:hypothetical protein